MITQIKTKQCNFSGQSLIEYFVILSIILSVIIASGFIDNIRAAFDIFFNNAVAYLK